MEIRPTLRSAIFILILAATAIAHCKTLAPSEIYRNVSGSVARLKIVSHKGEEFVASAFLVNDCETAITAWHAINDAGAVTAVFDSGESYPVLGVIDFDEKSDLAIIKLAPTDRTPIKVSDRLPEVGSWVYAIGSPRGYEGTIVEGLLSGAREIDGIMQLQVSCPFSPGNSGGPIVDEEGHVLGVASWSKKNAQNLNFAVPASQLSNLDFSSSLKAWSTFSPKPAARRDGPDQSLSQSQRKPYDQFLEDFEAHSGEEITIIMRSRDSEDSYTFTIP